MPYLVRKPAWRLPESAVTDERTYLDRRKFLSRLGLGAIGGGLFAAGVNPMACSQPAVLQAQASPLPPIAFTKSAAFTDGGRALTPESNAISYNNFYEFSFNKQSVATLAKDFRIDPYALEVDGLVDRPGKIDLDTIEALGCEERVYRFRCVEAWAMTVPWIGVPLAKILNLAGVQSEAKYVAFKSFWDPKQARNQEGSDYPFPYYEALRVEEAMNELTLACLGLYGKRLLPQSGPPLRIVVPWKYGFKGPKSVVKMTLTKEQPRTFWNDVQPGEYAWESNVDPALPHPRWSQATERLIESGERVTTLPYNGYAAQVAALYIK